MNHSDMINLDSILSVACSVTRCSIQQAKGRDRRQKCIFARFIYFAIAIENGSRGYVAAWHIKRDKAIVSLYKKRIEELTQFNPEFNVLINKAREKYARLCKSV